MEEFGGFAGFVTDMEAEEELRLKEAVAEALRGDSKRLVAKIRKVRPVEAAQS